MTVLPDEDDDDDDDDGIEEEEEVEEGDEMQEEDDEEEEEPEGHELAEAEDDVEDRTGTILFGPAQEVVGGGPANGSPSVDGVAEGGGAGMLIYFH